MGFTRKNAAEMSRDDLSLLIIRERREGGGG
jgi:septum formation topological specificity factor MinE